MKLHLRIAALPLLAVSIFVAFCFTSTTSAKADVIVTYGVLEGGSRFIDLLPNTPNQSIGIFASGLPGEGGADGMELNIQIGDGGSNLGGTDVGPVFQSVNLITNTIWEANGGTQTDVVVFPLARQSTVDTGSLVMTDGLVGTITFDTTGFSSGLFDFRTTGVAGSFDTNFSQGASFLPTSSPNGFIRIEGVPEPSSALLLMGFSSLALGRRRRK